jgi:hypothetical protein
MGSFFSKSTEREGFSISVINPTPLSGHEGDNCLFIADKIDGYREQTKNSPINFKARLGQTYAAAQAYASLEIKPANDPWISGQVIWMNPTADGGLPHTRPPGYICLPVNISASSLSITLLHERIHLHQRLFPSRWIDFVEKNWFMKVWNSTLPSNIEKNRRINPDLLANPFFIWKDTWVPVCLYNDVAKPSLSNASTVWYNTDLKTVSRMAPDGWYEFFGQVTNDEHPWEISAYYISEPNIVSPAKKLLMNFVKKLPPTNIQ